MWSHGLVKESIVHEITVPTCSYRMGERYMGVGAAVLSKFPSKIDFICPVTTSFSVIDPVEVIKDLIEQLILL